MFMEAEMSERQRQRRTKEFKFKVALEALKNDKQINEIAAEYSVHPNQVAEWKKQLLEKGAEIFASQSEKNDRQAKETVEKLYGTIGHQQVRIDWLKKKLGIRD
jgi:transposase-like protein